MKTTLAKSVEQVCLSLLFTSETDDLGCVVRVLHDAGVAVKWQSIGQTLTVHNDKLESIQKEFVHKTNFCLLHCIAAWLKGQKMETDSPSWSKVVQVIADPLGGDNPREACRVAAKVDGESSDGESS